MIPLSVLAIIFTLKNTCSTSAHRPNANARRFHFVDFDQFIVRDMDVRLRSNHRLRRQLRRCSTSSRRPHTPYQSTPTPDRNKDAVCHMQSVRNRHTLLTLTDLDRLWIMGGREIKMRALSLSFLTVASRSLGHPPPESPFPGGRWAGIYGRRCGSCMFIWI